MRVGVPVDLNDVAENVHAEKRISEKMYAEPFV